MAQHKDWREFLKAQRGKKDNWLILLLVGILLLVIAMPTACLLYTSDAADE